MFYEEIASIFKTVYLRYKFEVGFFSLQFMLWPHTSIEWFNSIIWVWVKVGYLCRPPQGSGGRASHCPLWVCPWDKWWVSCGAWQHCLCAEQRIWQLGLCHLQWASMSTNITLKNALCMKNVDLLYSLCSNILGWLWASVLNKWYVCSELI
jgi:hypothetical protein